MSEFIKIATEQIENGIKFAKCHKCGCQQGAINALEKNVNQFPDSDKDALNILISKAKSTFLPVEYDCLGCNICYPSILTNNVSTLYPSIQIEDDECSSSLAADLEMQVWPFLPGNYEVINPEASVAICTLNSKELISELASTNEETINIVGSLNTENLGVERIIKNITANPYIRYLIICGEDTQQKIGHLPGQTILSFFENGVDEKKRILGSMGKRPVLKNLDIQLIEQFRNQVEIVNMLGIKNVAEIIEKARSIAKRNTGKFIGKVSTNDIRKIKARPPGPLVLDPKGYFVVYPNSVTKTITVEHYTNAGWLNKIVEGTNVSSLYMTIIDLDLISRLDHACYLGRELAKADESIRTGLEYIQDKAQEPFIEELKLESSCKSKSCC